MAYNNNSASSQPLSPTPFDDNGHSPSVTLPPPISSRPSHQRSRTAVDLPPLFPRTKSASPTRFSTFLPSLKSSSRSTSPERVSVKEASEFDVDGAEQKLHKRRPTSLAVKGLANWFEGCSDPVNISLVPGTSPKKEKEDPIQTERPDMMFSVSEETVDTLTRRPEKRPTISPTPSTSRFSFFRKTSQAQLPPIDHDELCQMDIREALFPCVQPVEFSPAAYKNLQLNAEGTLRRFQTAHSEQQRVLRSVTSSKNVQADELEAAQTRNEHLKLQLTDMAERSAEQERLISSLRADLATAKNPHQHIDQQSSIRKVSQNTAPLYRRNRRSDISTSSMSENDSEVMSVFSEAPSMDSPGTSITASPVMKQAMLHYPQLRSPIQHHQAVIPVEECQKCHGVRGNEAWDVIGMMKVESHALKDRITELEAANGAALDLVLGLKAV